MIEKICNVYFLLQHNVAKTCIKNWCEKNHTSLIIITDDIIEFNLYIMKNEIRKDIVYIKQCNKKAALHNHEANQYDKHKNKANHFYIKHLQTEDKIIQPFPMKKIKLKIC